MAIYKIFPNQDCTLYSIYPEANTGLDEILEASLEVGAFTKPSPQSSRFLIQFDSTEINNIINNRISGSQWQSNLRCFMANVEALNTTTIIDVFPVSQSWNMGTGRYKDLPEVQNGASWIWKDYQGGERWILGSLNPNTTASYSSSVDVGGGTWYTSSFTSQSFGYFSDKDININVKSIVERWYSSSIQNNGFIVKQRSEFVNNENIQPKMKYFSIDTHTIYPPCLEFRWDDSVIGSSGLSTINSQPFVVTIGDNIGKFYPESIATFRIYSRPEYPERVFATASYFTQNYLLPTSSYYAVKDLDTNEYIIDFDTTYTKLSVDATSSYFNLYMNGLQPERYYSILVKTVIGSDTIIFDNDYYFKIVNG